MNAWILRLALIVVAVMAAACSSDAGDEGDESRDAIERSRGTMTDDEIRAFRESFQADYVARYEAARALADAAAPGCTDGGNVLGYVDALIASNRTDEAGEFAARCLRATPVAERKVQHLLAASRAARFTLDLAGALRNADAAAELARGKVARAVALERAELIAVARDFGVKKEIDGVLDGRFNTVSATNLVGNVIAEAQQAQPFVITAEIERDYFRVIDDAEDETTAAWLLYYMTYSSVAAEYRYHDALRVLSSRRGRQLVRALPAAFLHDIGRLVHRAIMNHTPSRFGWAEGETLVKAMAPFQRKDQVLFALATGPFDYAQLRATACAKAYASGADAKLLETAQKGYLDGTLTAHAALTQVGPLRRTDAEAKVDVEVFAGTMLEAKGDEKGALEAYWSARKVCPYYGRASSGAFGVMARLTRAAKPRALDATLPGRPPVVIKDYVVNYERLSDAQRSATAFGLSFFWPYLDQFVKSGRTLYVMPTFQHLIETPVHKANAAKLGPERSDDGRLTDDLDGTGGNKILVSFSRLEDYKGATVLHESAHQFHFAAAAPVKACITRLFNEAKARSKFCVGYAATDEFEYFGVGIQHFASPDGFVGYGGITKDWYQANDPKLLALMDSIAKSNGDMSRITCPAP